MLQRLSNRKLRTLTTFYVLLFCNYFILSSANFEVVNVDESTPVAAVVHKLPTARSSFGYTLYQWGDPEGLALFSVNDKGEITLKDQLNYEVGKVNFYYIIAILRNKNTQYGGSAYTRKFQIIDANNHSPKFAKTMYYGEIEEGQRAGMVVSGLEDCFATDLDSSGITDYTITEGNNKDEFELAVKDINGLKLLVVKTRGSIDRDEMRSTPYLDLGVQANDGGIGDKQKFAKTVIRIHILDINDNPPVFLYSNWRQSVQENSKLMSSIMKISASDNDEGKNAEVYYYFDQNTDQFYINPSTGIIGVADYLDVTVKRVYELQVVAQDKSVLDTKSTKTTVSIQVLDVANYPPQTTVGNNAAPRFQKRQYSITVRGDLPVKSFLFVASAHDPNQFAKSLNLEYSLSGSRSSTFRISRNSGIVTLIQQLSKSEDKFIIRLSVQDSSGRSDSVTLTINVQPLNLNNHKPVFKPSTVNIEILEDININTEVGLSVKATDADVASLDGKVSYRIVGGTGIGRFGVNTETGIITTKVAFKSPAVYNLYIRAEDGGTYKKYGNMYVQINVKPAFKIAPVISRAMYTGYIPEGEGQDSFVAAIFSKSPAPGKQVTYEMTGADRPQGLALDRLTGVITTTRSLDYEQDQYKFMEVIVKVQGILATTRTVVNAAVININDNPPVFTRSAIRAHVRENSGDIPSLVCLFATDDDGVADNPLKYSITSGNIGNVFKIHPLTGKICFNIV